MHFLSVKYNIKMKLGEVKGNGTDGNVYIQLFGSKGSTAKIQLRQAGDDKNRFETGQEYKFMVTTQDIGKVSCMLSAFSDSSSHLTQRGLELYPWHCSIRVGHAVSCAMVWSVEDTFYN